MIYPELINVLLSDLKKKNYIDNSRQSCIFLLKRFKNNEVNFLCSKNILLKNWRIKWERDRYKFIEKRKSKRKNA